MIEEVTPAQAWEALRTDPSAQLIDVRTDAEWTFVGLPDLSAAGKQVVLVPWQVYPTMQYNPRFIEQLAQAGLGSESRLFFICRSGARSLAAAAAAEAAGMPHSYNVLDGFEGPPDHEGHRGLVAGWKASALPWRQR